MCKIWSYAAIFFTGAFASIVMIFLKQKPQTVISAENYIANQEQKIGKIKQKGKDNVQDVEHSTSVKEKRASRKEKRASRKAKLLAQKAKLLSEKTGV